MGRKWIFQMLLLHYTRILALGCSLLALVAIALEGAAPRLLRPMYARANMGHPSREEGFVVAFNRNPADGLASVSLSLLFAIRLRDCSRSSRSRPLW
jgi:hypothetical protein